MQLNGRIGSAVAVLVIALALAGCTSGDQNNDQNDQAPLKKLSVVTSFYPLQYVTHRIAARRADVTSLTPAGAEPHDLPMIEERRTAIADSDLVIYLSGQFQPAVSTAVTSIARVHSLDIRSAAQLTKTVGSPETVDGGEQDPHFWLDPTRLNSVGQQIAQQLSVVDPDGASTYAENARALATDMTALADDYAKGLTDCARWVVSSHSAFFYLLEPYGLTNVSLGWNPRVHPLTPILSTVNEFLRFNTVPVFYREPLIRPDALETLARQYHARTMVLDPIEAITPGATGSDYLSIMRSNLQTLRTGQGCR